MDRPLPHTSRVSVTTPVTGLGGSSERESAIALEMANTRKRNRRKTKTEVQPHKDDSESFGEFVGRTRERLRNPELSQTKAAEKAGISRETWNRIERGKQLPAPANIPAIAETLKTDVRRLFIRAGYEVPSDIEIDRRKRLVRDFLVYWDEASSTAGFMLGILAIWLRDKQEGEERTRIYLEPAFLQLLIAIQENLSRNQQLRLAAELIERIPVTELRKDRIDFNNMLEEIDCELEWNKRASVRAAGGLYEIRSLPGMGHYRRLLTDEELTNLLVFAKSQTKE